jgi:hypothetical protein
MRVNGKDRKNNALLSCALVEIRQEWRRKSRSGNLSLFVNRKGTLML